MNNNIGERDKFEVMFGGVRCFFTFFLYCCSCMSSCFTTTCLCVDMLCNNKISFVSSSQSFPPSYHYYYSMLLLEKERNFGVVMFYVFKCCFCMSSCFTTTTTTIISYYYYYTNIIEMRS